MSEPVKETKSYFDESWPIGLLQSCPRCGNETHNYLTPNESLWFDSFTAGCYRCNHSEKRESWNLRPIEHKLEQQIAQLTKERDELLEQHRMELAAIMTATIQNTESTIKDRIPKENPYWTQGYADVCTAIDREMAHRSERDQLAAQLKELRGHIRCIYCNEKYTAEQSGELADHILSCEKSPLVQALKEMDSRIIDRMDMVSDEFQRILAITDNQEIIGICERAQKVIEQNEPVIKQRDDAVKECDTLKILLAEKNETANTFMNQVKKLHVERDQLAAKLDPMWRELVSHREKAQGNYWGWDKDKENNHLESLAFNCPVLIHAIDLKAILNEKNQLAAKCEVLTNLARSAYGLIIEHHSSRQMREDLIECPCCVTKRGDEILNKLHAAYTNPTQCGTGWLSPEKAGRLMEVLKRIMDGKECDSKDSNGLSAGEISVGDWRAAKQALEDCK